VVEPKIFQQLLYKWSDEHPRPMPWRNERDAYKIWISEIMLQQTRVEQAIPYFERFLKEFPTVQALADAPEQMVLKLWEGLGYNSRARNLHFAAKTVAYEMGGVFPSTAEGLLALKGIGGYTSAAIASFAFNEPVAVVDTNVLRVFARLMGITEPIDLPQTKIVIETTLADAFDKQAPARFNQAIMDFGALQCTPRQPDCETCPFSTDCVACAHSEQHLIPVKSPKKVRKAVVFHYAVIHDAGSLFLRQRSETDIWQGLWEFPQSEDLAAGLPGQKISLFGCDLFLVSKSEPHKQTLTHRLVTAYFYDLQVLNKTPAPPDWVSVNLDEIKKKYAVPGVIRNYLHTFDI
jgi:A/G-specific adenine glycosylase